MLCGCVASIVGDDLLSGYKLNYNLFINQILYMKCLQEKYISLLRLCDSLTEKNYVFLTNYPSILKNGYYEKLTHQTQIKTPS